MMSKRDLKRLNFHIKRMDDALVAEPNRTHIAIYESRKGTLHYIMSLTDTWTIKGKPVRWGIEPIQSRLRAIDHWNRVGMFEDINRQNEKAIQDQDNNFSNNTESFLYEFRKEFAKATNDINTGTLDKKTDRRRYGNR